ncbi:MAG: hypothetical protein HZC41_07065 [Chloroflexi bacterium]|nr:hypothetical protein [Chloroflexota bacterium]
MRETKAIIERVTRLNEHYQRLHLATEDYLNDIKPGQTVLARLADRWDPYLREQWWPVDAAPNRLIVERPGSLRYEPGQSVSLLGPVGQPYRYRRTLRNVLLLADDTTPTPLVMSMSWLLSNQISVTLVLAGQAALYPTQHLPPEIEVQHADATLGWPNRVMTVGWADQVFVVVRPDDELGRFGRIWSLFGELRAEIPKSYLFGIFQPVQPCGVGACQACLLPLRGGETTLACTQGPAVDLTQVRFS